VTRVGLVLGAGGVTGEAFHRGVLAGLTEVTGFDPASADVIVGTSAGSLVAASLRCARSASAVVSMAAPPDSEIGRRPDLRPYVAALRRPWSARVGVLATSVLPAGTRTTEMFVDPIRRRCGAAWPARDLYVCAVRRRDGRRVVFGMPGAPAADVASAVAASCAIPAYFRPVTIDGEAYVDGGVHSPTNADVLAGRGLDLVVVSAPMSVARYAPRATLDLSARLLWRRYLRAERRALERAGTLVLAIEPGGETLRAMGVNTLSAARVDRIEDLAREATVAALSRPEKAGRLALLGRTRLRATPA
jgi:NTE family protein